MHWLKRNRHFMLFRLSESERTSRGLVYLALLYVGAMVVAALLAPPVFWGIHYWHEHAPNALTRDIIDNPFQDTYDRLRWLPTLVILPFLLKSCGLLSWSSLGLHFGSRGYRQFLLHFFTGILLLSLVAGLQSMHYGAVFRDDIGWGALAGILLSALIGCLLIGMLEEIVFRGMALRMFYTRFSPPAALLLTSIFFSYAHFKMPDSVWESTAEVVTWGSGWYVGLWTLLGIIPGWDPLVFLNLILFGLVLGILVLQKKSLMPAVGFHAGIVMAIMVYRDVTTIRDQLIDPAAISWIWGTGGLRDGLLTTAVFALMIPWLLYRGRRNEESAELSGAP